MTQRVLLALALAAGLSAADLKLGIIGLDTSHVAAFTRLLNDPADPRHVAGARVVAAYRGGSPDVTDSYTRLDKFTNELTTKYGIEIVPDIPSLVSRVDAVLVESVDGRMHLEQVKPVIAARKPVFIDKPLAATWADVKEIARLAKASGVPWFSSSSERYSTQVTELAGPPVLGAYAWGPATLEPHHPVELAWYGIHTVEMLYTLMGPGCETVANTSTPDADLVVGRWKDGRIGALRGGRGGKRSSHYGVVVYNEDQPRQSRPAKGDFYDKLLMEVVKFFQTGVPPVPNEVTLEIYAFMDAAQRSKDTGGQPVKLER